jgi:two-component sensor histidine kinase
VVIATARDITALKRNEQTLREAIREKDVMLREIHHRVKNNMQVISSLLRLQTWSISDPALLDILDAAQKRIRSIAFVHEKLYQSKNFSRIDFREYLQDLLSRLRYISGASAADIAFDIAIRNVELDINRAIPCGLIVNELVSNALKHAFPEGGPGQIRLTMEEDADKRICLSVGDNGIGLPDSVDIRKPGTLGLQIVSDLVKQLDGTMDIDCKEGTTVTIRF